jgi:hypothetical protein
MFNPRIDKHEAWLERQSMESAEEIICEYFAVSGVQELTQEQIKSVAEFRNELSEYSPLFYGFTELIYTWQDENNMEIM